MKILTALTLTGISVFLFAACVTPARISYFDFPSDMADEAKTANLKLIEKGRVLYNINCAKCHNKKQKGKIVLPDFTSDQLESYSIRIKNETHVNSLPESRVTAEELEAIQFFFNYKKPSTPAPKE